MNIAIVGSRNYPHLFAVIRYVYSLPADTVVISGGAPGVDTMAKLAAQARWGADTAQYVEFPADWKRYGRSAGFRRNRDIVAAADVVVAFWFQASKGTGNSVQVAREMGKQVVIFTPESEDMQ